MGESSDYGMGVIKSMRQNALFKRLTSLLLAISLLNLSLMPQALADGQPARITQEYKQAIQDYAEKAADWSDHQTEQLENVFELASEFQNHVEQFLHDHSETELQGFIDSSSFVYESPSGLGKATYVMIGGIRVLRVWLTSNDQYYLMLDESRVPQDPAEKKKYEAHLNKYVARIHMEAGKERPVYDDKGELLRDIFGNEKRKLGRDLNILSVREGHFESAEYLPKPKATQWKWWKEKFLAVYNKPTINDFTMALFAGGLMQGALVTALTGLKSLHLGTDFSMLPAYFTAAYGVALGTFYSTYKNWGILSGTRLSRVLKNTTVSLGYAFGLVLFVSHGSWADKYAVVDLMSSAGFLLFSSVTMAAMTNNYAKDYWNQIIITRDTVRAAATDVKLELFGKEVINWKRSNVEAQVLYLIPWSINVFSLMTMASTDYLKIPGTDVSVPAFQLMGIPIAMLWAKWYSKHLVERAKSDYRLHTRAKELQLIADKYERVWKNSLGMDVKDIPKKIKSLCQNLLKKA